MKRISILLVTATTFAVPACAGDGTGGDGTGDGDGSGSNTTNDEWDQLLGTRVVDYNAALKVASLRLNGDLPTMDEISQVRNAGDEAAQKAAYETLIQAYMARPAFANQMFAFWRDTFKMGETPALDAAPAFAAQLSVENRSYMELFTATANTCPTFDGATGAFTPAACAGTNPTVGVLTDPGAMSHYFGNFAFRRVRWVQETFDCAKFPIEIAETSTDVGGASPYTGVWPFTSISDDTVGRVNFRDTSAVICANCHSTMNHIAPLFANFDRMGAYQQAIAVPTPLDNAPLAELSDYLPTGEPLAWRYGINTPDLASFGAAMAADADVAKCGVARVWNWALGKTDIVDTLQEVPVETIQGTLDAFTANGFKMRDLIYAVYTSDDFVKF
jgi:hypothetical protein